MSRVVVVSNRVASPRQAAQSGGVAVAIADLMHQRETLWVGWSGAIGKETGQGPRIERTGSKGRLVTLSLTEQEHRQYYLGYANSVLWPVFHNRVDLAQLEAGYYASYQSVNRKFADALKALLRPDDIIWVHDYHFVPLADCLRRLGVTNPIGFFLHIPFPPSQAFLAVPENLALAHAFAAYDLVGLQTTTDVAHMIDYLEHGASGRLLPDGRIRVGDRVVAIAAVPVGIDPDYFAETARGTAGARDELARILGVDRLDYTKGLPQKFRGFGRFLQQCPEYAGKVILTQIAAPTRESVEAYTDIRKELESVSGAINGAYSDLDWVPIHYINRTIARSKLPALYRNARIGLVTPLRDGMNLVAKEYVASQDVADPGVLVLSRFAGAAEQMHGALIINPYNIDEIAQAIASGLEMGLEERRSRHATLMAGLSAGNVHHWSGDFLARLKRAAASDAQSPAAPAKAARIKKAMRRLESLAASPPVAADGNLQPGSELGVDDRQQPEPLP